MILAFVTFEKELYKASCEALDAIKKDCQNEQLYSFALVTTGLFGYVFPNANTEEGIIAGAKGFRGQLEIALKCNRWEPSPTWRFFKKHYESFEKINNMLDEVNMENALCKLPKVEFRPTRAKLEDSLFSVLNKLRKDGLFGKDNDKFYANISYQDQTLVDLHRCALRVNFIEVCNTMQNDLSDVEKFWDSEQ
jgi:Domain of unknown function (DUF4303)